MEKKAYENPAMRVVKIQQQHIICGSNPVSSVNSGVTGIGFGGGGSVPARARQRSVWDN